MAPHRKRSVPKRREFPLRTTLKMRKERGYVLGTRNKNATKELTNTRIRNNKLKERLKANLKQPNHGVSDIAIMQLQKLYSCKDDDPGKPKSAQLCLEALALHKESGFAIANRELDELDARRVEVGMDLWFLHEKRRYLAGEVIEEPEIFEGYSFYKGPNQDATKQGREGRFPQVESGGEDTIDGYEARNTVPVERAEAVGNDGVETAEASVAGLPFRPKH